MVGTRAGGLKAKKTILAKSPNHYRNIGILGGRVHCAKGFALDPERARRAGRLGGTISRRSKKHD